MTLGIAFVGSGFSAKFHLRGLVGVRNVEVKGVYSRNLNSSKEFAMLSEQLGLGKPKVYSDISKMLSDKEINAVWLTVPNDVHLEYTKLIAEEVSQGRSNIHGITIEKPLARNVKEAKEMIRLVEKAGLLHGYLENQIFMPSVVRAREAIWEIGSRNSGRPYLARAAEEHSGPHNSWFWRPTISGGGALIDMTCHSLEATRFLLTDPAKTKSSLKPKTVYAETKTLKWNKKEYAQYLKEKYNVDFLKEPAEDYALTIVTYEDDLGNSVLAETRTSWNYVGPGLRLSVEVLGPEYSVNINTLQSELSVFFSRNIKLPQSEAFVEKQNADQGLMPIILDEAVVYGYQGEDRHMVESFISRKMPFENWYDGLLIVQLMMHAYLSAENGRKISFDPQKVEDFIPKVARGLYSAF
ncbi:Gfo/Idh/MocA family protein [Saccharolobus solfataricus]|uniref:Dehydrogenase, putative n=3 Tax=Saccharolobus solfataricus TaxID=2287 RepID=Q97UK3_SACS2|nr:Gfo/Idh/MocA family oxidoreductase [Saccharolobus solfataricus]AET42932.1 dehydrogenase-like protein [Saccharolobus solfataricus 98/2]AAK43110.1 Dehydrogenase, putative [Saccharolobus solfataricus P2]AKA73159.1 gfo/Idh/MocA family oxidoreductase [Saccharolobus solfataricus]AKA75857.1 gfo/Idh/MocA family oxidoreductase [Saccharolobus solfataricus]AKA78549.1 gfo/Idh/MocA family oxidoreductase [Saccharolobus solfataricus]